MSADIVSLTDVREARTPHLNGPAECAACGREWVATAPVGTVELQCPSCGLLRGFFANPVVRGTQEWACNCGARLFRISKEHGPYCVNCGEVADGWF